MDTQLIQSTAVALAKAKTSESSKRAVLGFDGFIDTLVRVIHQKSETSASTFFKSISEFGAYTVEKNHSFSLEVKTILEKPGGNMPIMSQALSNLGISCMCIGPLGVPQVHPKFQRLQERCTVHSFGDPGRSFCMEFGNGKIMLADMGRLNETGWQNILETIGKENLLHSFESADLICLLNWSEIDASTDIWKGLLRDIFPELTKAKTRKLFIDFSDGSKRSKAALLEALDLVRHFADYFEVTVSVNRNEAMLFAEIIQPGSLDLQTDLPTDLLRKHLAASCVVLHTSQYGIATSAKDTSRVASFSVKNPAFSTGAGDNFNAGFCKGILAGMSHPEAMVCGHATAAYYITHGISPSPEQLTVFLNEYK
jgi:hypothetical protein